MEQIAEDNPQTIVSQSNRDGSVADYCYPSPEFVMVNGSKLHLWVAGIHFVEDEEGSLREGQYFVIQDPGMGIMISEIESIETKANSITVRHLWHWHKGELTFLGSNESWSEEQIVGDFDRTMPDVSNSIFLQRTE